jgi:hypothetical protein
MLLDVYWYAIFFTCQGIFAGGMNIDLVLCHEQRLGLINSCVKFPSGETFDILILSDSMPLSTSHVLTAAIVSFDGANVSLIFMVLAAVVKRKGPFLPCS